MSNIKDKNCLICSQASPNLHLKITDSIEPNIDSDLTIYKFLQSLSNFNKLDYSEVPQNVCGQCHLNILQIYCFQMICNKSVENLQSMKERSNKVADKQKNNVVFSHFYDEEDDEMPCEDINPLSEGENDYFNENSVGLEDVKPTNKEDVADLHSNLIEKTKMNKSDERIECPDCNRFYKKKSMSYHRKTHTGERPYKCEFCPKDFVTAGSLKNHRTIHLDERPYLCTVCGAQFRISSLYYSHFRRHTGVRPYPCEICGKSFKSLPMMQEHISVHSDARPFACVECPKNFRLKKHLRQHMITHAEIKPIECIHCGKRFTQKQNLRSHQANSCQGPKDDVNVDLVPKLETFG